MNENTARPQYVSPALFAVVAWFGESYGDSKGQMVTPEIAPSIHLTREEADKHAAVLGAAIPDCVVIVEEYAPIPF